MTTPITGGCVCGAIRYEITAQSDEIQMFKCHCRDCQRLSGGPYAPVVFVPARTFKVTRGAVRHHFTPSTAGGEHKRGFCTECGSRLTGGEGANSTSVGVTASSLDDPSVFRPQFEMWTCDAQPWDPLDASVPHFKVYPPAG